MTMTVRESLIAALNCYVFGTSNCIYTGMDLTRYELMLDIWRTEGVYANR